MALANHCTETQQKTQKHYVVLNNGSFAEVPDGVNPEDTLRLENRKLANREARANGTARRTSRTTRTGRSQNSRRTNYAAQVLQRNSAMAELVVRVNEPTPDPTMDDNLIIIHTAGYTAYMSRETGEVSYV